MRVRSGEKCCTYGVLSTAFSKHSTKKEKERKIQKKKDDVRSNLQYLQNASIGICSQMMN